MKYAAGLRPRKRKGGVAWYWVATAVSRHAKGFIPSTVRIHATDPDERARICQNLTAELREWMAGQDTRPRGYDGTIKSLISCYLRDEDSPYHDIRHSTRKDYDYSLNLIERAIGGRLVDAVTSKDVRRWYRGFREGGHLRRAHGCMKLLRILAGYGRGMRYPGCDVLRDILSDMEFELPQAREQAVSFEQASLIVREAIARGRPSLALGQALQFECSLRQVDVIGYWVPGSAGITDRGEQWAGGVTWSDVSPSLVLKKRTTKTAAKGEWDLNLCPLVMLALEHFPSEKRIGPMVIREATGLPYKPYRYTRDWRALARAVGIPDDVWNRDSRAGGITEGDIAGAEPRDLQNLATHSDPKTTRRYIRSTTLQSTTKVAQLRVRSREKE